MSDAPNMEQQRLWQMTGLLGFLHPEMKVNTRLHSAAAKLNNLESALRVMFEDGCF